MDIEGTYTLQASPEDVWGCLMDQQVLRHAIPGVEKLESLGQHEHGITLQIRQSPLIGVYHGRVVLTDQHYPYHYSIAIEGEGRQSTISGHGVIHLSGRGENTVVAYKGTVNIGKLGTLLPAPVVKGAARLLLNQFFTSLADHLRTLHPVAAGLADFDHTSSLNGPTLPAGQYAFPASTPARSTFLRAVVHILRLGEGEPDLEELWVHRIRRAGLICGFLLLVWVGTRLPRRSA
jgi:carbon monoxide dehydrogenase subunit G